LSALSGSTALDTSALVEYLMGAPTGALLRDYLKNLKAEDKVAASLLTIAETYYVLCRLEGQEFADEKLNQILSSRVIEIYNSLDLALETGRLKCQRTISLADCSCIATARHARAKAVFAFREEELVREMERKSFDVTVVFLQDMTFEKGR